MKISNSNSNTLREYANILDSTQKGMAIFLRQVADEIDEKNNAIYELLYSSDNNATSIWLAMDKLADLIEYKS